MKQLPLFRPAEIVLKLVDDLPEAHVVNLVNVLEGERELNWGRLAYMLKSEIPQLDIQERVSCFMAEWQALSIPPEPEAMAQIILGMSKAMAYERSKQEIELTWTGPQSGYSNLRRTDQALLELIRGAKERILIVSFAVYKVESIRKGLVEAADRGWRSGWWWNRRRQARGRWRTIRWGRLGRR